MTDVNRRHFVIGAGTAALAAAGVGPIDAAEGKAARIPMRKSDTYEGPSVNVVDFGARGDGQADDTEAIRKAVKAAFERRRIPQHPQYGYFVSFAEVYFPSGHYRISDTIDVSCVKLRGENYAAVEQADPDKDLFAAENAWRQLIEGLTLLGGRVQLNLGNRNIDTGHVTVRDCQFYRSRSAAVQMRKGSNSTFFKVENCLFRECEQAVINHCDMAVVRDCWISTSPAMRNKAALENHGVLHVENLLGVPHRGPGEDYLEKWIDPAGRTRTTTNQRWIDNHEVLHVRNSRFGGEGGGFSAVWNFAPYRHKYPVVPTSVTIESSYLYNSQSTAIVLKEIPNLLTVSNCHGLIDCWLVRVDPQLDLDTYFQKENRDCQISIDVNHNYGGGYFGTGLPEQLMPYQAGEIQADAVPAKGHWLRGQMVRNRNLEGRHTNRGYVKAAKPAEDEPYGWYCIESGRPGKWKAMPLAKILGD